MVHSEKLENIMLVRRICPSLYVVHDEKLEKFNDVNSKRWKQKMLFYLTTLSWVKIFIEDAP
jgi:hypothetical protein